MFPHEILDLDLPIQKNLKKAYFSSLKVKENRYSRHPKLLGNYSHRAVFVYIPDCASYFFKINIRKNNVDGFA